MSSETTNNSDAVPVFHDAEAVTINTDPTDLHICGHLNTNPSYEFSAKIFDRGSVFGISGGPISKLIVRCEGAVVAHYDRGWIDQPRATPDRHAVASIVQAFTDRHATKSMEGQPKITRSSPEKSIRRDFGNASRDRQDSGGRERSLS